MKWIESTIGDVCDAGGGEVKTGPFGSQLHQSDYSTVGTPVVMPKDIIEGDVSDLSIARIGPDHVDRLSKHKLNEGDIVYGRRGDIGRQALITKKTEGWLCGTGCLRVTIGKPAPVIPSFLHLYLRQNDVISWIANQAVGATMPNLNTSILRSVPVIFPESKAHQEKLADIVCSYDDLIENNNRRIAILEEMAQSLYREWFVKFRFPGHDQCQMIESPLGLIPEGWETKKLLDISTATYGFAFKAKQFNEKREGTKVVRIRDVPRNDSKTYSLENPKKESQVLKNGDLLVGMDGDFHMGKWAGGHAYLCQRVCKIAPNEGISPYFTFLSFNKPIKNLNKSIVGTTVAHLGDKHLKEIMIITATNNIMESFAKIVDPIFKEELNLRLRNQNLKKQRDLLLPKLISGQIDLSQAEQESA